MFYIPPELVDAILLNLDVVYDAKTLSACCRVSRLWLPLSRRYLFSRLRLKQLSHSSPLLDDWLDWHGFLRPRYADLSLVTGLDMACSREQLSLLQLSHILAELPDLRYLTLDGYSISSFLQGNTPKFLSPPLESLELCSLNSTPSLQNVADLLGVFHYARTIHMRDVTVLYEWYSSRGQSKPLRIPHEISPTSLVILRGCHDRLLDIFKETRTVSTLRRLHVSLESTVSCVAFARFLESLQQLEVLEMDSARMHAVSPAVAQSITSALAQSLSLHTFSLSLSICHRPSLRDNQVLFLTMIPPNTRRLLVAFHFEYWPADLGEYLDVLSSFKVQDLDLCLRLSASSLYSDDLQDIHEHLAQCLSGKVASARLRIVVASREPLPLEMV